jgi:alpha-beta hydrolase superfamily lysophospholipase
MQQTRLMFFPSPLLKATPATVGLSYETVWLTMPVGRVQGWWIPAQASDAAVVLYLHGNGSNLGDLVNKAKHWHNLGVSLLMIDYRGYGQSEGPFPSEASVYADAEAAWHYLTVTRYIHSDRIVVYGQSLGGAVAIDLAAKHPAAGVIVESSFTSIQAMAAHSKLNYLFPLNWLLTQRFDSLAKIRSLKAPVLIIHGTADQTIPATMSQTLYAAAPEPKQLILIANADHNTVAQQGGAAYWQHLRSFIWNLKYTHPS